MLFDNPSEIREPVVDQLNRILASRVLVQSPRLSRFLAFLIEKVLNGEAASEYVLGIRVFDRDESFDPRVDPIVRVNAHKLRAKLKAYYDVEGVGDAIEICLPVRSYLPTIRAGNTHRSPKSCGSDWSAPPPQAARSLAILPITALSMDKQDKYFADGLTQELIHALVKLPGVRVMAWTGNSSRSRPELPEIARKRNVQAILMGTLRRLEAQVRVSVQLVSAVDGSVIWSTMLNPEGDSKIATQERIADLISEAVRVRLLRFDRSNSISPPDDGSAEALSA